MRHPQQPDWGIGQIQSIVGHRVTVNFENVGKIVMDSRAVVLEQVFPGDEA